MKRIGILSDTHIPGAAQALPERVREIFQGVDLVLHAGDHTSEAVLDQLRLWGFSVLSVRGNMDSGDGLSSMPEKVTIPVEGHTIGMVHGWGAPRGIRKRILKVFEPDIPSIIVYGHTHSAFIGREAGVLWINPGSPTDTRFSAYLSVAVLEISGERAIPEIIPISESGEIVRFSDR